MQQKIPQHLFIFLFWGLLSCLTIAVGFEYYTVKKQIQQLHELQDLYRTYASTLKMILDNYQEESGGTECYTFAPVNRTPDYLWQSTADFFKRHDLEFFGFDQREWQDYTFSVLQESTALQNKDQEKKEVFTQKSAQKNNKKTVLQRKRGHSALQVAPFAWPIDRSKFWLSSLFGPRRKRDGSRGFHHGIDMAAVKGTPVRAARSGTVIEVGYRPGYGNTIVIQHSAGLKTRYAHLHKIYVVKGKKVTSDTIIGAVGETGYIRKRTNDGSHLHFEVYEQGRTVDPLLMLPSLYI